MVWTSIGPKRSEKKSENKVIYSLIWVWQLQTNPTIDGNIGSPLWPLHCFPYFVPHRFHEKYVGKGHRFFCCIHRLLFRKSFNSRWHKEAMADGAEKPFNVIIFSAVKWKQSERWQHRATGTRSSILFVSGSRKVWNGTHVLCGNPFKNNLTVPQARGGSYHSHALIFYTN